MQYRKSIGTYPSMSRSDKKMVLRRIDTGRASPHLTVWIDLLLFHLSV